MKIPDAACMKSLLNIISIILIGIICTTAIYLVNNSTKDKIENNAFKKNLELVRDMLDENYLGNELDIEVILLREPAYLHNNRTITVFRAEIINKPVGVVYKPVIASGYNGPIQLAIGISIDGTLREVRVLEHDESRGLGDQITKDKSDWLEQFEGSSFNTIDHLRLKVDGGHYDVLSGATITSRSVVNVIQQTLEHYKEKGDILLN